MRQNVGHATGMSKEADAKLIEKQKDELLDTVEERLRQTIEEKTIFAIRWSVV